MAALPTKTDPTLEAIDHALVEHDQAQPRRGYVGASSIAGACERKLWYDHRQCSPVKFSADTLKKFDDGHRGEDVMAERLRMVEGVQLVTHKPDGGQYGFSLLNGHFQGHYDGIIIGILQAPKTPHTWEHKQVENNIFNALNKLIIDDEKSALEKWNETYYGQAQLYMHAEGLTRHYLTCSTPGGRKTISVRTDYDAIKAEELILKAERIISRDKPPMRLSNDPAFHQCKNYNFYGMCEHYDICHQRKVPLANCRNCVWATPDKDGDWLCRKHGTINPTLCESHIYIPEVMPYEQVGADSESESIIYRTQKGRTFKNGPSDEDSYLSTELQSLPEELIGDITAADIRNTFDAKVVENDVPF